MNIVDICQYKYPGQIDKGNIEFRKPEREILIAYWNVPDEPQPTEAELLAYGQEHQRAIEVHALSIDCASRMESVINNTARERQYDNGVSCAGYANSTNEIWKAEADAFIAWRDKVWEYAFNKMQEYLSNEKPLPTLEAFIEALPKIEWSA